MKKVLITYGDQHYKESLERIRQEATKLALFDEIYLYDNSMLPAPFNAYTEQYSRGGGYWLWKPWIIHHTLAHLNKGDIVVYVDAGCTLVKHKDWEYYFDRLKTKEALFFIAGGKNQKWCKRSVFDYFNTGNDLWKFANQIQATFLMVKKTDDNEAINRWYQLAEKHPELFIDVPQEELSKEAPSFKEHRHDQSVLTACICFSTSLNHYCFLPEKMEKRYKGGQAVLASRISKGVARGVTLSSPPISVVTTCFNRLLANPIQRAITQLLFVLSQRL